MSFMTFHFAWIPDKEISENFIKEFWGSMCIPDANLFELCFPDKNRQIHDYQIQEHEVWLTVKNSEVLLNPETGFDKMELLKYRKFAINCFEFLAQRIGVKIDTDHIRQFALFQMTL